MSTGLFEFMTTDKELLAFSYDRLKEILQQNCAIEHEECLATIDREIRQMTFPKNLLVNEEQQNHILRSNFYFTLRHENSRYVLLNIVLRNGKLPVDGPETRLPIDGKNPMILPVEGRLRLLIDVKGRIVGVHDIDEDIYPIQLRSPDWGRTPFDDMTPHEMRRQCQRLYSATEAMFVELSKVQDQAGSEDYYWNKGPGAKAIEKGRQALQQARGAYDPIGMQAQFFTYANDLLFKNTPTLKMTGDWMTCPDCHNKISGSQFFGKTCSEALKRPQCKGILKHLSWSDFKTEAKPMN